MPSKTAPFFTFKGCEVLFEVTCSFTELSCQAQPGKCRADGVNLRPLPGLICLQAQLAHKSTQQVYMVELYGSDVPASFVTIGDGQDGEPSSSSAAAANGLAGNLVSAIRSFLPGGRPPEPQLAHGKKPVKVELLQLALCWQPSCSHVATYDFHAQFSTLRRS